jgi:hypothetical protein
VIRLVDYGDNAGITSSRCLRPYPALIATSNDRLNLCRQQGSRWIVGQQASETDDFGFIAIVERSAQVRHRYGREIRGRWLDWWPPGRPPAWWGCLFPCDSLLRLSRRGPTVLVVNTPVVAQVRRRRPRRERRRIAKLGGNLQARHKIERIDKVTPTALQRCLKSVQKPLRLSPGMVSGFRQGKGAMCIIQVKGTEQEGPIRAGRIVTEPGPKARVVTNCP